MLPALSRAHHTPGHQALAPDVTVPPSLVKAANSRSVPIARCGFTPKMKISTGVIGEPPPPGQSHDQTHGKTSNDESNIWHGRDCRGLYIYAN